VLEAGNILGIGAIITFACVNLSMCVFMNVC
jgi:hypothetical protein